MSNPPESLRLPRPVTLFLLMLVPAAMHYWPYIFDWRLAALAVGASAAGAFCASRLNAPPGTPFDTVPLFRRSWFAVWAGFTIALALPHVVFRLMFGHAAAIPEWAPLLAAGPYLLDMLTYGITDAAMLAAVPAVIVAFCCGSLLPGRLSIEDNEPAAESASKSFGESKGESASASKFSLPLDFLLAPLIFIAAACLYSLLIPKGTLLSRPIDVVLNVWNQWWFRKALFEGLPMLETDYIYHPHGVSLYWHTFGLANNVIGLAYRGLTGADGVSTYNFMALLSLVLMGWASYLLARRITGVWGGFFAGFAVALCGAHMVQLSEGHLGLANAQWVLFFLLFALRAFERGSVKASVVAGVFWVIAFYTHFYHGMFCGMIIGLLSLCAFARHVALWPKYRAGVEAARSACSGRRMLVLVLFGGTIFFRQYWAVLILLLWTVLILRAGPAAAAGFSRRWLRALPVPVIIFAAAASPWIIGMHKANLAAGGGLDWSRPPGYYAADVCSYVLPAPGVRGASAFDFIWENYVDTGTESINAFLGLPVIAFAVYGLLRARKGLGLWILLAAVFGVLSFGTRLHVAGVPVTQGERLPYVVLELMPFWDPGGVAARFSLLATVAIAMVASAGVGRLVARGGRMRHTLGAVSVLAVIVLGFPPVWSYRPPTPEFLSIIRDDPSDGVVLQLCESDTMFWLQTHHEKRIVHGFASRPSPAAAEFLTHEPVFSELYYGKDLPVSREEALEMLRGCGIRWIIVAEGRPRGTVEDGLGLAPIAEDTGEGAWLYMIQPEIQPEIQP